MKVLIRNAEIINHGSRHHLKKRNVIVENGKIGFIGSKMPEADKVVKGDDLKVSAGWFDMNVLFGDPGYEYKEDLKSGLSAASNGGFTGIGLLPNTQPAIQTKNDLAYIKSENQTSITQIFPYAAVTRDVKGEDLTDMIDLDNAGATAFTDGVKPIWKSDILLKTLQYLQKFNGLLINRPEDLNLNLFGNMHEGKTSTILGMKGMPSISEEIMIARDIRLLEYAGGKFHFSNISTGKGLEIIGKAKKRGLNVTCDVAAHQFVLTDQELTGYDTNYKVNPPLREASDSQALVNGLKDGTIDAITSSHRPHDEESKKLEFDHAEFGMIGLQTVLHCLNQVSSKVSLEQLIALITSGPRNILGIKNPKIEVGEPAELTVFSDSDSFLFDESTNHSRSNNSPWLGKELTGKILAVFNNKKQLILG